MSKCIILGVRKFSGKDGKNYEIVAVRKSFSEKDQSKGCFGETVEDVFIPENKRDFLKPEHVGKEIVFDYEINGRYANVIGFKVI